MRIDVPQGQFLLSLASGKKVSVDVLENFFHVHVRVTVQNLPPAYHTLGTKKKNWRQFTVGVNVYVTWF